MPRAEKIIHLLIAIWSAATCRRFAGTCRRFLIALCRVESGDKSPHSIVLAVGLTAIACLATGSRGQTQTVADQQGKPAEEVYKNIQVLTGLPAAELDGAMSFMSAALGVGCTHCHTNPWDSDAKSTKLAARKMILMTRAINKENFSGNPAITCYTCHRGRHNTEPVPPAELATATDATSAPAKANLPPSDEIVEHYIRAIGGEAAIAKLKTRVSRGTETTSNRMTPAQAVPIEMYQTEENKLLIVRTSSQGPTLVGFDGSTAWARDAQGQPELSKALTDTKLDADFFRYLKLRQAYPQMRILSKERVGDREAYVVGATSREDSREKLYFDVRTGLLIRRFVAFKTMLGAIPDVTDFDDYREVNGVKLPFTIRWSRPPFSWSRKFIDIRVNQTIDAARFEPPRK